MFLTEQMDAEGLGRKLLPTPAVTPAEPRDKECVGTGPRKGFWVISGSLSPKTAASILHIVDTCSLLLLDPGTGRQP